MICEEFGGYNLGCWVWFRRRRLVFYLKLVVEFFFILKINNCYLFNYVCENDFWCCYFDWFGLLKLWKFFSWFIGEVFWCGFRYCSLILVVNLWEVWLKKWKKYCYGYIEIKLLYVVLFVYLLNVCLVISMWLKCFYFLVSSWLCGLKGKIFYFILLV